MVQIPESLKREAKAQAAHDDLTFEDLVNNAIYEFVTSHDTEISLDEWLARKAGEPR
jgi:hypothetical protein